MKKPIPMSGAERVRYFGEGQAARRAGVAREDRPHGSSLAAEEWLRGWDYSDRHDRRKPQC